MQKRLLDHNPDSGITQWFIPSTDGSTFTIHTSQEVEGIIEDNKQWYNALDEKARWDGDMHRVARIPIQLFYELKKKGIADDNAKFKAWLNGPEQRYFRVRPGRV